MQTFFERQHHQAEQLLGADQVDKFLAGNVGWASSEVATLWFATWPLCREGILYNIVWAARKQDCSWLPGAMAMQNPNMVLCRLEEHMKAGRQYYWWNGRRHNPYGTNGLHWLYEAGLKNPLLQLLDWEHPGSLADFLGRVDSREEI